ncbi:MAG: hypothetical protein WC650_00540 [Candidatus Doudnabacteria bacterium]
MNKLSKKQLLFYKIIAVIAVLFLVGFLRYAGGLKLFCAQDGSIFEIAKVVFWAMIIYGLLEFLIPGFAERDNIFFGKLAGIVSATILTAVFIMITPSGFTTVFLSVAIAVIIAQFLEQFLSTKEPNCSVILVTTLLFLFFLVSFIIFSYHPLGGFLFER